MLNILISILGGTLLSVGGALILELIRPRIRSADDLTLSLDLPVLAVLEQEAADGSWLQFWQRLPGRLPRFFAARRTQVS